MPRAITPKLVLPLAALLASLPLLLHGASCGHDLGFHVQSWLDAAAQLRHGHYPHWAITPAWNAGEPRFVFYPPLSWLFGALLTRLLPIAATPAAYIFLTMTAAGFTMHRFARSFAPPHAALLAAVLYLANPYMLFNAFERSAMAELLASVWIPLLLLAILRPRPTLRGIAVPLALLWLTNAPAAVMGSYTFALLAAIRIALALLRPKTPHPQSSGLPLEAHPPTVISTEAQPPTTVISTEAPPPTTVISTEAHPTTAVISTEAPPPTTVISTEAPPPTTVISTEAQRSGEIPAFPASATSIAINSLAGATLGLALPAFYLLPAAYERRFVQVAMAIIPNMRFQDNFLFTHTADTPHNDVNTTASYLTLTLLATAVLTLSAVLLARSTRPIKDAGAPHRPQQAPLLAGVAHLDPAMWAGKASNLTLPTILALLTAVITLLLVPLSTPIWLHLPEFAFLQFPWRLNTILSAVAASAFALLFSRLPKIPAPATLAAAILLPLAFTFTAYHLYAQGCDINAHPTAMDDFFRQHHGVAPTDEYTPTNADNDLLRTDNPAFWLAANPNAPAPDTVATPIELNPVANTDDYVPPADQTLSTPAPHHLSLDLPRPAILVLHLRDYPAWRITRNATERPTPLQRDDGLIALALPAGPSTIDIAWHTGLDQILGCILSALALCTLACLPRQT